MTLPLIYDGQIHGTSPRDGQPLSIVEATSVEALPMMCNCWRCRPKSRMP